ncbi:MAG: helix-turn-helix domain-containing protein [Acidobacteriota bacterium]
MTATALGQVERLLDRVTAKPPKPFYLKVTPQTDGSFTFEQIEFMTVEQAAELAHVNPRTLYLWIDNASVNGLKSYKAPGSRNILFDINEFVNWIKGVNELDIQEL